MKKDIIPLLLLVIITQLTALTFVMGASALKTQRVTLATALDAKTDSVTCVPPES